MRRIANLVDFTKHAEKSYVHKQISSIQTITSPPKFEYPGLTSYLNVAWIPNLRSWGYAQEIWAIHITTSHLEQLEREAMVSRAEHAAIAEKVMDYVFSKSKLERNFLTSIWFS